MSDYLKELQFPDPASRGLTRWWWYGCAVKKEEIITQLDEMAAKGIGGVEIQIMYPVTADDEKSGRKNIEYFSPEFFEILDFTSKETKKRGMTFDVTLGSSWPFGGPFVPYELSAPQVIPYSIEVTGPKVFNYDFTTRIAGNIVGCVMGKMEHSQMLPETIVDLSDKLKVRELYNWPWGTVLEGVEVPEGDYKIVCFVSGEYREHVLAPTRGAEGLVIDHNRKDAARLFFEHAGDPIVKKLGKGAVKSFFCDSIEVSGHNWTDIMYEEFEKRRGYSLKPYIYALWGEIKGITDRVRYDFHKTYGELTVENFFREMTDWCHEVGSTSRIQVHGTWGDPLLAYGAADIPEGETFSANDVYTVNTIHRRLASSAGNLYHKPIISNESFTWLRFPRFTETLEQIKVAADAIFVDGMNQIVNHGFTYTPEDAEDWAFYASSHISSKNTWWKFYGNIGNYIHRVSHFLQKGKTVAELCIYLPHNDIWAENPLSDLHMCMQIRDRLEDDAVDGIAKAGYWFDYINDEALGRFDEYEYKVLILMENTRLPVETAENLQKFAEAGNLIICAGHLPVKSCGLMHAAENDARVEQIMTGLKDSGKLIFVENKREALVHKLKEVAVPDLTFSEGAQDIGYVHKKTEDGDIYFVSNMSKTEYVTTLTFKNRKAPVLVVDPMTLQKKEILQAEEHQIQLRIEPLQSLFIFFDEEEHNGIQPVGKEPKLTGTRDISADWILRVPEKQFEVDMVQLQNWQELEELKYFSGTGIYEKTIEISLEELENEAIILKLSKMDVCARIFVNEQCAGDIIKYPYEIEIGSYLKEGSNHIRIEVANLLINRVLDPAYKTEMYEGTVIEEWPYFTKVVNDCRRKRISNWRERNMVKEPFSSGLAGQVLLQYKNR